MRRKGYIKPESRKDYTEAIRLYQSGLSLAEIAERHGITRQAMHDILRRRNVQMRSRLRYGSANHFYRGGKRASDRSQNKIEKAISRGHVQRADKCEVCGASPRFRDGRSGIQAHHPDYNKPLEVMWLCQKCHHEWHRNNKAIERRD